MMNIAGEAQTLASSLTHSAFNISNALGAAGEVRYRFGRKLDLYGVGRVCFFPVSTSSYVHIGTHY
jgi:predicted MFS family arabinose efflux permease